MNVTNIGKARKWFEVLPSDPKERRRDYHPGARETSLCESRRETGRDF
jgi:hypothetical protein